MSTTSRSPRSLADAVDCLAADPQLRPVAGCTDLMVTGALERTGMTRVMDLLRVPELGGVIVEGDSISIGATTTFAEIGRHPDVRRCLPCVCDAAAVIGGWQIQTRATVGGNIANASPAGDSLPVWLALGATVVVIGPGGSRQIPYARMHVSYRRTALAPGEVIERLRVPRHAPGTVFWFRKIGQRQALAISKVVIAGAVRMDHGIVREASVAAGSVAPVPIRLPEVERFLVGQVPSAAVAEEAGRLASLSIQPIDDVRSTAAYRTHALGRTIRRLVLNLAASRPEGAV